MLDPIRLTKMSSGDTLSIDSVSLSAFGKKAILLMQAT